MPGTPANSYRARLHGSSGFTLVELMITVAIIAILVTVAFPLAEMAAKRSKEQELRHALRQIREGIDAYKRAWDTNHIEKLVGQTGYPPELDNLVEGVRDIQDPNGNKMYFLRRLPRDPMSTDAQADPAETWGLRSYESPPDDPSEGDDVFDVYSLSDEVGLNGVPYREW